MKLHRDLNIGLNLITAVDVDHVTINGQNHTSSLLVLPQHLHTPWASHGFEALTNQDFQPVIESGCDVLLLGTGRHQRFPHPSLLQELTGARIGVEVMDTAAACRTFNILVAEGRNVAAALLIE